MRDTILPLAIILTKAPYGRGKYDGQGVYCCPSTATEVFLIFTTQLYSCQCNYDAIVSYLNKREVLQQEYSHPNTSLSLLQVGSKI